MNNIIRILFVSVLILQGVVLGDLRERESLPKVISVSSPDFSGEQLAAIQKQLGIKIGKRMSRRELDRKIRTFYLQGRIQTLRIEAVSSKNGLRLIIKGTDKNRIRRIDFKNVDPIILDEVRSELSLDNDTIKDTAQLVYLQDRLVRAYQEKGFYSAIIEVLSTPVSNSEEVDVVIQVRENAQTLVRKILLEGAPADERGKILEEFDLKAGDPYSQKVLDEGIQRVNRYLRVSQYLTSQVQDSKTGFSADRSSVDITLYLKIGNRFQFEFNGNTVFPEVQLRELMSETVLSQADSTRQIANLIESKYKEIGYHFCTVDAKIVKNDVENVTAVRFQISEGRRVLVDHIYFIGKKPIRDGQTLDEGELHKLFFDTAPGVLKDRIYWERGIAVAVSRFQKSVRMLGYLRARVGLTKVTFTSDKRGSEIYLDLETGTRTMISDIEFVGVEGVPVSRLKEELTVRPGEPLNPDAVEEARNRLRDYYQENGYLDMEYQNSLEQSYVVSNDRKSAYVKLEIKEGRQYRVGTITIEGNRKTKRKVILRALKQKTGEIYNNRLIRESENEIALLGLFSRVEILSSSPPEDPNRRDLKVVVKETKPGSVEIGAGGYYEPPRFRLRTFGGIGYRNLFGLNHSASFRGDILFPISTDQFIPFLEYTAVIGYRSPYPFEIPIVFASEVGLRKREISNTGNESRIQRTVRGEAKVEKALSRSVTLLYRLYRYEQTVTEKFDADNFDVALEEELDIIGSTGPGLIVDLRDDVFNPTRGSIHRLDIEFAHPALLSEDNISFLMGISRNSFYFPLFSPFSFNLYVGLGYAYSLLDGEPLPKARLLNDLSLGGSGSLRGFDVRQFQPAGEAESVGFYNFRGELGIELFEDLKGIIFLDTGQLVLEQPSRPPTASSDRHDGVGIGIRYKTPVGPVAVDIGWDLERTEDFANFIDFVKFYFTIGTI